MDIGCAINNKVICIIMLTKIGKVRMDTEIKAKKNINMLPWLCSLIYFMSYLSRKVYAVSISIICDEENVLRSAAGLAVTGLFISYGIGQIISGVLGDKIPQRTLVTVGLIGTAICNILVGIMPYFAQNIIVVTLIWVLNGLFQSFFWPPLVKLVAKNCNNDVYVKTISLMTIFSQIAEILLYLIVPGLYTISNWRLSFIIIAILCIGTSILWMFKSKNLDTGIVIKKKSSDQHIYTSKALFVAMIASGILLYSITIIIMGMIRDGVTTWAPSFTKDTFNISSELSILITVVIAIVSMIGIKISSKLVKKIKNEMATATLFFVIATICMTILIFVYDKIAILTTILLAISIACMHGANLMLIGVIPSYFNYTGRVSTVSGIINGIIYAGSAISIFGFAKISEKLDWKYVILIWVLLCLIGTLMLALNIKRWKRFSEFITNKQN